MRKIAGWFWFACSLIVSFVVCEKIGHGAPLNWMERIWVILNFVIVCLEAFKDALQRHLPAPPPT